MNLTFHLLSRIALAALICLIATAIYVLYQTDRQSKRTTRITAESIDKQLELQLQRIDVGFDRPTRFPDLQLWTETTSASGVCVRFNSPNNDFTRSVCNGAQLPSRIRPNGFARMYRWGFNPGLEVVRQISFNGRDYGSIIVAPDAEMEIARAWEKFRDLLGLFALTVAVVCLLVYSTISRALRPAHRIVAALGLMEKGDLSVRLPPFELIEWQRTGTAINQLAANQQQLLSERAELTRKLVSAQEEERRFLARELHDELGQCLAAINAIAASIAQTAERQCPALVPEANNVSRIGEHMMGLVRGLLTRLRPPEIDGLGLAASLNRLVAGWNARCGGSTHYQLIVRGNCDPLPEPVATAIFRIVQECLTNIAKHSAATSATVTLEIAGESIRLLIEDDGCADQLPFADNPGLGWSGIRERVAALGGQLTLATRQPSGLMVQVTVPFQPSATVHT